MRVTGGFCLLLSLGNSRANQPSAPTQGAQRDLLVRGKDTEPGQYPWHVRVGCCSGALIAPDVVLSAGHVLPPPDAVSSMKLYVGAYYVDPTSDDAPGFGVQQAWLHPKYTTLHYDFSLFLLDDMVSDDVEPVRLNEDDAIPEPGSDVTLLGTGTFNLTTSERPTVLQSAVTQTMSNDECRTAYDPERAISYAGDFVGPTNLCTTSAADGCVFDSGGPIVYHLPESDEDVLVALISFGVDCADPVYPAVNARVSAVYDWIANLVCEYSRDPPAEFACDKRKDLGQSDAISAQSTSAELVNDLDVSDRLVLSNSLAGILGTILLVASVVFGLFKVSEKTRDRQSRAFSIAKTEEQQRLLPSSGHR